METISWLGSFLLAACGAPLAWQTFKDKKSNISISFLYCWFFGEIFTVIYTIYKKEDALTFNYLSNIFFILIILKYKHFPVDKKSKID